MLRLESSNTPLRHAKDACNIADPMLATCLELVVYNPDNEWLYFTVFLLWKLITLAC